MAEKKIVVPEILAILPVRDTVLFPGAVLPLTARERSISMKGGSPFLIDSHSWGRGHWHGIAVQNPQIVEGL